MATQNNQITKVIREKKRRLDRQIESIGWALFFVWSGALLIAPDGLVPEGSWLIGTGLIIILSMGIRYLYGIRVDRFWIGLGFLALGFGISGFFSLNLPVFPVLLIIGGLVIIYNVFFRKDDHKWHFRAYQWQNREFWDCCWHWKDFCEYSWKGENGEKSRKNSN